MMAPWGPWTRAPKTVAVPIDLFISFIWPCLFHGNFSKQHRQTFNCYTSRASVNLIRGSRLRSTFTATVIISQTSVEQHASELGRRRQRRRRNRRTQNFTMERVKICIRCISPPPAGSGAEPNVVHVSFKI